MSVYISAQPKKKMTLKPLNGFELYFRYLELAEIFSKHVLKAR